ncbi:putative Flp pilus-assembly TadE/G-like protein [Novosphingobium sp. PhB165]|uniref:TadE/TadG family type IV pilus assembly protein n=1 Tax=Novosphingobium sp. PhB165 TaxID=2485105 RepID=UPI00104AE7DF|nr:pilus assembly protein TadG-related protein [Novosphingobium sp. PhB165]TCM14959.1 putative Flp pilus-assembly TadE/G-like protein [Novosphingobium sp. PhB165]
MKLTPSSLMSSRFVRRLAKLKSDQRGNMLILMGFAIVPLTFTVGFGIDYARAMRLRTQLNAAADAAVLAAVAPTMILQSDSASAAAATSMFNSQAALLSGYQNLQMTPTITASTSSGSSGALGYLRKATISYTVQSINLFGGILGHNTLTVTGTSSASAQQPPNVDFYLAMDNSPSMLLPATSDGIKKIQDVTGCAFACHQQMPHSDSINVKDPSNRQVLLSTSYYTSGSSNEKVYYLYDSTNSILYTSSGTPMNTSSTSVATPAPTTSGSGTSATTTAKSISTVTSTTYSITDSTSGPVKITKSMSSQDTTTTTVTQYGNSTTSTSTGPKNNLGSSTYDTGYWADGYWLTHNYGLLYGSPSSLTLRKDDVVSAASQLIPFAANQAAQYQVTYRAQMFSFDWTRSGKSTPVTSLNTLKDVATYGSGFSVASLFPADDYWWKNSQPTSSTNNNDQSTEMTNMLTAMNAIIPTAGTGATGSTPQKILFIVTDGMLDQPDGGGRYFGPLRTSDLTQCTAIKAKGIKIAVLYTQYLPESLAGDSWSQTNVAPFLPAPPSPYPAGGAGSSDQVLTALQSCASPGTNGQPLVQTVTTTDNITTALQQLFSTALQTVRLVQ